jgi:hypothetical protein
MQSVPVAKQVADLAKDQHGVVSRVQLRGLEAQPGAIVADLRAQMAQAAGEPSVPERPRPAGCALRARREPSVGM